MHSTGVIHSPGLVAFGAKASDNLRRFSPPEYRLQTGPEQYMILQKERKKTVTCTLHVELLCG